MTLNDRFLRCLEKKKSTVMESSDLSGHGQVARKVPPGLRFKLLSLHEFSTGLGKGAG